LQEAYLQIYDYATRDHDKENKETTHMQNDQPSVDRRVLSLSKIASYAGIAIGVIVLVCVLVLLLFPNPFLNNIIKPRITKAFTKAYPAYTIHIADLNYSFFKNRLGVDSVTLSTVDGLLLGNISSFSADGIGWMHLLWRGKPTPNDFVSSIVDAQDIVLNFRQSHYVLYCKRLHVSVPDSEVVIETAELKPSDDDEQLFAESEFRKTRFHLVIPDARVIGVAWRELLTGNNYHARSAQIRDAFLDVLVNKDKPCAFDTAFPPLPNKILATIGRALDVDSLNIMNGGLKYGERFAVGANPALITVDSIRVVAEGIANHGNRGAAIVIRAQGKFNKAGNMKVLMTIPVESPVFSYKYSGSLSGMDLRAFNSFLETAEQIRIKDGMLQSASFEINVVSGNASGSVNAVYGGLTVAAINKETGSEKGISDRTSSIIAKIMKIRGSNLPDKSSSIKVGKANFTVKRGEFFFEFSWFALRSGVQDIVGF
jgi:hypothetical protein